MVKGGGSYNYFLDIPDVRRNHTLLFFPLKIFSVREIYSDSLFEMFINIFFRAGEPANFCRVPAPDFFFKRLGLRLMVFFFQAAPAPRSQKHPAPAQAPDYWLSLPKYSFPHKLVR